MQDNSNIEKRQAEALSDAIDALNKGAQPEKSQEAELAELIRTANIVKNAAQPQIIPPRAILDDIVTQAAANINHNKKKKRLTWGFAGLSGAAAAVLLFLFLNVFHPGTQEQQLAKTPEPVPAPVTEAPQPPMIAKTPPDLITPQEKAEVQAPSVKEEQAIVNNTVQPETGVPSKEPLVALVPPPSTVPADSSTMLALRDRKADVVTIDAASKIIRQVYHQGAPDEIIITQAPKRQTFARAAMPKQGATQFKASAKAANESSDIKPPNRNKVTVTVEDSEVTLEGSASEEELLTLAKTMTKVSVAK